MQASRMLIPRILKAINRYMTLESSLTFESVYSNTQVHSACIRILNSISTCCRSISKLKDVNYQFETVNFT